MGRIRDFFNRIMRRRETRLLETTTQKEIKKFIDELHNSNDEKMSEGYGAEGRDPNKEYFKRDVETINNFISLINDGKVDIGGDPAASVYKRMLTYFDDPIIRYAIMSKVNKEFYDKIVEASNGETYEQVHSALDKTLAEYFRTIGSDKKVERLFEIGKVKELKEIINKNILLVDTMEAVDLGNKVAGIYEGTLLYRIRKEKDVSTQIALYEEYIRDFRDGKEVDLLAERDYLSSNLTDICQMEFMQERELRKRREEYRIPLTAKVSRIYKVDEKSKAATKEKNDERCEEHMEAGKVETSDLVLVRTTTMFPKGGIVETTDKHSDLLTEDSPFARELEELKVEDEKFNILKFQNRRTIHFTLNGLVGSHEYGDFKGRNFIIIEPFEEHVNDDSLMNINEADTYFGDNMVLSKRASILIPVEKYKELIKDQKMLEELNKFDVRLFDGDESKAVEMCLVDRGYTYGEIAKWGFEPYFASHKPMEENERLIETKINDMVEEMQKEGKEVASGVHFYSESKKIDDERTGELVCEELKIFVEAIAETADFEFSKTALMNELLSRRFMPKTAQFEEGDLDKPKLEVKELLEKLTLDGLAKATKKYNDTITEQHDKAREEKDEELKQKGLISKEPKLETKEDRDGK